MLWGNYGDGTTGHGEQQPGEQFADGHWRVTKQREVVVDAEDIKRSFNNEFLFGDYDLRYSVFDAPGTLVYKDGLWNDTTCTYRWKENDENGDWALMLNLNIYAKAPHRHLILMDYGGVLTLYEHLKNGRRGSSDRISKEAIRWLGILKRAKDAFIVVTSRVDQVKTFNWDRMMKVCQVVQDAMFQGVFQGFLLVRDVRDKAVVTKNQIVPHLPALATLTLLEDKPGVFLAASNCVGPDRLSLFEVLGVKRCQCLMFLLDKASVDSAYGWWSKAKKERDGWNDYLQSHQGKGLRWVVIKDVEGAKIAVEEAVKWMNGWDAADKAHDPEWSPTKGIPPWVAVTQAALKVTESMIRIAMSRWSPYETDDPRYKDRRNHFLPSFRHDRPISLMMPPEVYANPAKYITSRYDPRGYTPSWCRDLQITVGPPRIPKASAPPPMPSFPETAEKAEEATASTKGPDAEGSPAGLPATDPEASTKDSKEKLASANDFIGETGEPRQGDPDAELGFHSLESTRVGGSEMKTYDPKRQAAMLAAIQKKKTELLYSMHFSC